MPGYTIRYNARTNHIQGIAERTTGATTDRSQSTGVVSYYAASACAALSRSGHKMGVTGETHANLADALAAARASSASTGRNLCKTCEKAAEAAIARAADIAERQAASDAAQAALAAARAEREAAPSAEARAQAPRTTYIHRVNNPFTGAVEFPESPRGVYAWVGYRLDHDGRSLVVGYSNDPDEATAIKYLSRFVMSGTDVVVAAARPANAAERDYYLKRRAELAPTDAKRAKWAKRLTDAALDYARTDRESDDSAIAQKHLIDLVDQAMRDLGGKWKVARAHVDHGRRILTRADNAARMYIILERDLDNHARPEAIEHRLTQALKRRDELITALEAVTTY